jgi:HEAT repeat protein
VATVLACRDLGLQRRETVLDLLKRVFGQETVRDLLERVCSRASSVATTLEFEQLFFREYRRSGPQRRASLKAALALGAYGEEAARPGILQRLKSLLSHEVEETITAMLALKGTSHDQMAEVVAELRFRETIIAVWAAGQLHSRASEGVIDSLAVLVGAECDSLARQAWEAIQGMGQPAIRRAYQTLLHLLASPQRSERDVALRALATLDRDAAEESVLELILKLLRDGSPDLRLTGIWAVQAIGKDAMTVPIRVRLVELLTDADDRVQHAGRDALSTTAN